MDLRKILISVFFFLAIEVHGQTQVEPSTEDDLNSTQLSTLSDFEAIILGLVEGITEFLPISSTGHLILTGELLGIYSDEKNTPASADSKQAVNAFIIIIQAGAIAAVLGIYWKKIYTIFLGIIGRNQEGLLLARNLALAFLPAALLGLLLKPYIDRYLFGSLPVITALFLGGILMLFIERWHRHKNDRGKNHYTLHQLSARQALFIGLCQSAALWPGMSRSMTTLIGGYLCGLSPKHAAQFSFLLGLPTLTAAALYETTQSGNIMISELGWRSILLGSSIAAISAAIAVKWMIAYLEKYGLALFAWYRIGLAFAIILISLF